MTELNLLEAVNRALHEEMERDGSVFVIGEDVGAFGGAFQATAGLQERFGERRVIDSPMSEWALVGMACGAAMEGLRPVVEIQFADFISTGFDTLVQYAATTRYRWGASVPIVVRAPWGGGSRAGPFHSQCPEAWLVHTPGLKVVIPSTPADAKGLLAAAIRDPDPVVFFEPKHLYRRSREAVPEGRYTVEIGPARVRRRGRHLTLVTYGAMVEIAMLAAERLANEGRDVEVIDLRTLAPLDHAAVRSSVERTGRLLVLHEARRTCGVGAEIAATLCETAFYALDAPPVRVTAPDTPVPYSPPLEDAYRPDVERVARAALDLLGH